MSLGGLGLSSHAIFWPVSPEREKVRPLATVPLLSKLQGLLQTWPLAPRAAPKCRAVGKWERVHPELPRLTLWWERELSIKASNTSISGPFCVTAKVHRLSSTQASSIPVTLYPFIPPHICRATYVWGGREVLPSPWLLSAVPHSMSPVERSSQPSPLRDFRSLCSISLFYKVRKKRPQGQSNLSKII